LRAAFYIRKLCEQRAISIEGLKVIQNNCDMNDEKYMKKFAISVELPTSFPQQYKRL
jgi:hypothetical protein